ncbi:MAG TPA: HAD family hydrolase [Gaiellaceae bacterium]|nr:HAD family hydrolase [Gaiellaceae bacterium]
MNAALLDLDGTLVDSNYQHALAWYRAFRRFEIVVPMWRAHRHIGMGGDQLVPAVAGEDVERRLGDRLREAEKEEFAKLRDECAPLEGAHELVTDLKRRGHAVVLASSSNEDDLDHFLELLEIREVVDGWTTADDVARSKPHPDVIQAALEKAGTDRAVMVGDSRWDIESAANAGLETVCVITGGWSAQELRDGGAVAVFDSLVALRESLDETPLR